MKRAAPGAHPGFIAGCFCIIYQPTYALCGRHILYRLSFRPLRRVGEIDGSWSSVSGDINSFDTDDNHDFKNTYCFLGNMT